jgi:hypothetical protein
MIECITERQLNVINKKLKISYRQISDTLFSFEFTVIIANLITDASAIFVTNHRAAVVFDGIHQFIDNSAGRTAGDQNAFSADGQTAEQRNSPGHRQILRAEFPACSSSFPSNYRQNRRQIALPAHRAIVSCQD